MTKGKVVLVPFPFDDLTTSKVRPAVCLTDPIGSHRHVIVAFISIQTPADPTSTDVVLDPSSLMFRRQHSTPETPILAGNPQGV